MKKDLLLLDDYAHPDYDMTVDHTSLPNCCCSYYCY